MERKPNPRTGGYTLIELMIAVVIIAILSSIALPAYTQFTVRAKLIDALAATEPIKLALVDYAIANGGTSGLKDLKWNTALSELGVSNEYFGDNSAYVKNAWWSHSSGEIRVSIANIDELEGRRFVLRAENPDFPTTWRCISDDSDESLIPSEYLPSFCQTSADD
ncbi:MULTISPECIES: prepilin-type N-terminal cleavage/methylation domain-containing protein [unclassified Marinobacterium]|uniref:pilin n=1 Tax=unclassified Marinobacterium TaxID=2644139 RepID=UPI001569D57C|nr:MULTISPECIES: prepilin-type N-terminal cleavage/methylation domain-containing protein [unclassified Marinobacterium]NRP52912.1 Fimbrial protein precursor [Marinobacterium sp. xm-v-242]NRP77493.1 Fimbrial protein precursor [Marinobacterium sp. xm-m-383]